MAPLTSYGVLLQPSKNHDDPNHYNDLVNLKRKLQPLLNSQLHYSRSRYTDIRKKDIKSKEPLSKSFHYNKLSTKMVTLSNLHNNTKSNKMSEKTQAIDKPHNYYNKCADRIGAID